MLSCVLGFASNAFAQCSRPIKVPVSATGLSVTIENNKIGGIYADVLRELSAKEACNFQLEAVPRARMEALFQAGQSDILIPASHTPLRDKSGIFVPLISNRALLISLDAERVAHAPIRNMQDLLERRGLKVALVRGYDYGEAYQVIVRELQKQGRLVLEADPGSVARTLKAGSAALTIMAPTIFAGAVQEEARVKDLSDKLSYEAIAELPWGESGVYISKTSLNEKDAAILSDIMKRLEKSDAVWKAFQRYYAPSVLKDGIRGLKE